MSRQKLIAQIHIAKKDFGMDDELYRRVLIEITGKASCKHMSDMELARVKKHMIERGWNPQKKRQVSPKTRDKPVEQKTVADKIRAMWIDMARRKLIADGSERALGKWCLRQTKKHSVDWLDSHEQYRLLETLKKYKIRLEERDDEHA